MRRRAFRLAALIFAVGILLPITGEAEPVSKDDAGRPFGAEERQRVVSVGGSITEILYELGLGGQVAAVDTTSLYPPEALKEKPNIGYIRALSAEGLLSVNPGLVLAEEGAGPHEAVELLKSASVPYLSVPSGFSAEDILAKIDLIGRAMDVEDRAADLSTRVAAELAAANSAVDSLPEEGRKKVLFVLSAQNDRLLVGGAGTQAAAIIEMAGGESLLTGVKGYKPVDNEAILAAQPDIIVMMARNNHTNGDDETLFNHPALKGTPAALNRAVIRMNGLYLLGFGPRTAAAIADLATRFYPGHAFPAGFARKGEG